MIERLTARLSSGLPSWPAAAYLGIAVLIGLLIVRFPLSGAVGLIAGSAVLVLILINPLMGLGLALFLGPFGALEAIVFGPALLDSGQVALMVTFAAWIGTGLARRRLFIPASFVNIPWLFFVLIAALSLLDAYSVSLGLVELLKWLEIGLIMWLILDMASDPTRRPTGYPVVMRLVLGMLLLAGVAQAFIGIWQFGLRGQGPEHFLVLGQFYRAYGTFEQPNPFGGYMNLTALTALGLSLGLGVAWIDGRKGKINGQFLLPHGLWLGIVLGAAAAASLGVILSWSRGAWLGFLAGAAVLALFSTRRLMLGILLMGAALVLLGGGLLAGVSAGFGPALAVTDRLGGFREEFTLGDVRGVDINDANYSVLERLAHWQAAVGMARDDLWTGVGFGNYSAAYGDYDVINFPDALGHAHNYYLNLLAEVGLPGLLAYGLFWVLLTGQSIWLAQRVAWPERGIVVGLLAAWVALAVHHLVDKLYVNNIYVHLGAMIGLLQLFAWPGFWVETTRGRSERLMEPGD